MLANPDPVNLSPEFQINMSGHGKMKVHPVMLLKTRRRFRHFCRYILVKMLKKTKHFWEFYPMLLKINEMRVDLDAWRNAVFFSLFRSGF